MIKKNFFCLLGLLFIASFLIHSIAIADITSGSVSHWKFDEGSGTTAAGNNSAQSSSASATTQTESSGGIPSTLGWYEIPNTKIDNVCACSHGYPLICNIGGTTSEGCSAITADWNSAAFDTTANRMLIWGGGHNGYAGNEVYSLNLDNLIMSMLTTPTANPVPEADPQPDGKPNSVHTYDALVYLPNVNRFWKFAGSLFQSGNLTFSTFALNLSNLTWEQKVNGTALFDGSRAYEFMTDYDPSTQKIFIRTGGLTGLFTYDFNSNVYTKLNAGDYSYVDAPNTGIIDVKNKMFVTVGPAGVHYYDISGNDPAYTQHIMTTTGWNTNTYGYPGLAYDSDQKKIVAWAGGDTVYVLNPSYSAGTGTWTPITYQGGPDAPIPAGTYKRFSYSPKSKVFVLYNKTNQNAYTLRLYNYGSSDTSSPTNPANLSASAVSSSQINLSWTTSSDNVGVTGYKIYRAGIQIGTSVTNSYSDSGLSPATTYSYTVSAYDAAGNNSGQSNSASATTETVQPPPTSSSKFPMIGGCTNVDYIDADCDGFGPGSPSGVDSNDSDASINTTATTLAKHGSISNYLSSRGYPNQSVYYIASNGTDSGVKNDPGRPYIKWSTVEALLQPGDVVMFRGGTYYGNATTTIGEYGIWTKKEGTAQNPIVIMNYPGEKAIINTTAAGLILGGGSLTDRGAAYVIVDGLVFANTRGVGGGEGFETSYSDYCTFRNIEQYGYKGSFWGSYGTQSLIIEGSNIHDNAGHGIYLGTTSDSCANFTIQNNLIHHNGGWGGGHGLKWNGRLNNATIQKNIIHSNGASGIDVDNGLTNSVIDSNYIFNNENQGIMIYNYPSEYTSLHPYSQTGNTISKNVIWVGNYAPAYCSDANTGGFYAIRFANDIRPAAWQAGHYYQMDPDSSYAPIVYPSVPNGYYYKLATAGTSGVSQPNWNTTPLGRTTDGTVQWITIPIPTFDNNRIINNYIVTYDGPTFYFDQDDYWDTTTISGNRIFKTGSSSSILKIAGSYFDWSQFQAKNPAYYTGNVYGDPRFKSASVNYCAAPGNFDFNILGDSDTTPPTAPQNVRVK